MKFAKYVFRKNLTIKFSQWWYCKNKYKDYRRMKKRNRDDSWKVERRSQGIAKVSEEVSSLCSSRQQDAYKMPCIRIPVDVALASSSVLRLVSCSGPGSCSAFAVTRRPIWQEGGNPSTILCMERRYVERPCCRDSMCTEQAGDKMPENVIQTRLAREIAVKRWIERV